jgi:hypothetical protein
MEFKEARAMESRWATTDGGNANARRSIRGVCASLVLAFLVIDTAQARTWGALPFDNDVAVNWLQELKLAGEDSIASAFRKVNQQKSTVLADDCAAAIAAGAVVAAARDGESQQLPSEASAWLQQTQFKPGEQLWTDAHAAVSTCRKAGRSELYMNWMAMQDAPSWLDSVKNLIRRLSNAG